METKNLALTALFAALYAILVLILVPFSFQLVQVRVADALIPLSIIYGWPAVIGMTVGCIISNIASPIPSIIVDITLGSIANLVASFVAWKIGSWKRRNSIVNEFLGCLAATFLITFIVGTYLAILTEMELWIWWLSIWIGSAISINVLGYALVQILKKLEQSVK
ncbi:MAG: QueT transporter family protein [Candidatus Bathyarchaeia archaeon]